MSSTRRTAGRVLALTLVSWFGASNQGCSSKPAGPDTGSDAGAGAPIFPATFRQSGFQMVRACRAPGEHSALNGFTVWTSEAAAATYDQLLSGSGAGGDGGAGRAMPDGAIVIKELFGDRDCTLVDRWVAMKKIAGFDPANGDWYWQDLAASRAILREGALPACSVCHEGRADGTCIGYGATNGMDYLCTAP